MDDFQVNKYLDFYEITFPGLFDPAKRKTDAITRLESVYYKIDTQDHQPIKERPRRYSPAQEQAICDFVKANKGILIQKSLSLWASAAHLVPKKPPGTHTKPDRKADMVIWRFCVDYRQLNKLTKKHAYPLPNTMDQIQRAAGHVWYCFIDLKDGFWHILIYPADREKTAFLTPNGLYEWIKMPMGLINAPAIFQSLMEEVLMPYRAYCTGLLDDVAVWANTKEELHERV